MVLTEIKMHRQYFAAHTPGQKLFMQLTVAPEWESLSHRPDLSIVFAIDTSGSMREKVATSEAGIAPASKLDLVIESLSAVMNSPSLKPEDRLALVSFDDETRVNTPFLPATKKARHFAAIHSLSKYSGSTFMGSGLREAMTLLASETGSRRIILLTDGEAMDVELVAEISRELCNQNIPVTAIGVGKFNESVLMSVADRTQGRVLDVVSDHTDPLPPAIPASKLPEAILGELEESGREVVTDLQLKLQLVKGVELNRITRVAPQQVEVDVGQRPYTLGHAAGGQHSTFILEFTVPSRATSRIRMARMGLTFQVPGADYKGESTPTDIVLEYTTDETKFQEIDNSVMQWVQQRNVEGIIKRAVQEALNDPASATKTLRIAHNLTQKLGNSVLTKVLDRALDELETDKTISLGTAKTMKMGSKTQTLKADGLKALPPSEEIRKLTGA